MNSSRLRQGGQVQFLPTGIFLCTLYQLTISVQLNHPLPLPQIGEDYGKSSKVGVDEAAVETGRLEEHLVATHGFKYTDRSTQEMTVGPYIDTSQSSQETLLSIATPTTILAGEVPDVINTYPADFFSIEDRRRGWIVLHILGLIYMLLSLIIVCDEFFVPALEVIISKLAISSDVAGATFMAAGRSIPKFLSVLIGVLINQDRVNTGAIVGPAVFNILFVIGMCALFSRGILHLTQWPLFRDISFYILVLILLIIFFLDNLIMWWESLILVVSFILYGTFMKFNAQAEKKFKIQVCRARSIVNNDVTMDYEKNASEGNVFPLEDVAINSGDYGEDVSGKINSCPSEKEGDDNEVKTGKKDKPLSLHWPETKCKQASYLFLLPIILPLWLTVPDVRRQESRKFFVVTYLVSILWIVVFSYFSMWWAHQVGVTLEIPHFMLILPAAILNPDLITSVIVARKGLGDMAVSSNVGTNIFEITVSLPLPWLLYSFIYGFSPVAVTSDGLVCATVLLFLMLFLAIISIISCKWKMHKVLGSILLFLYLLFVIVSVMLEYRFIVCPVDKWA